MTPHHWHYTKHGPRTLARASAMSDLRDSLTDQHARERQRVAIRDALRRQPDEARDPETLTTTPDADSVPDFEDPNTEE